MHDSFVEKYPLLLDVAWMVPVGAMSVVTVGDAPVVELLLSAGTLLPLLWRRMYPLTVFVVVSAVACLQIALGWPIIVADVGLVVSLFSVAALCSLRLALTAMVAACLGQIVWIIRYPADSTPPMLLALLLAIVLIWTSGRNTGTRRLAVQALRERALLAEEAAENDVSAAVTEERVRIARELHDTIAHNVSVMVVQAEGARLTMGRDPAAAEQAIRHVVEAGQVALSDMREMVAMFRSQSPLPWPGRLKTLVTRMERAGLHVDLRIEGTPPKEQRQIVHTIVREGLTNALKHAGPGAKVTVRLEADETGTGLTVEDDGGGARLRLVRGGHGLTGLREQVRGLGGALETSRLRPAGFALTVRLPHERGLRDAA
ncbi:sensor histidine kinase [Nonomuraea sp. NPDC050556]|uniref:sensor histidine kinase n=1 Tax=Nonomuraea sp. NPDC050556 TaxID=3364369 RepID=UPI00379B6767